MYGQTSGPAVKTLLGAPAPLLQAAWDLKSPSHVHFQPAAPGNRLTASDMAPCCPPRRDFWLHPGPSHRATNLGAPSHSNCSPGTRGLQAEGSAGPEGNAGPEPGCRLSGISVGQGKRGPQNDHAPASTCTTPGNRLHSTSSPSVFSAVVC